MSAVLDTPTRPRRINKRLVWALLLLLLVSLPVALAVRAVLIRRMLLPRLALSQPGYVLSVALTPDGKTAVAGVDSLGYAFINHHPTQMNMPADVFIWDTNSGQLLRRLHGLTVRSNEASISPDGRRVFAVGSDAIGLGTDLLAWNIDTGRQLWNVAGGMPLSVSSDGRFVGSAGSILRATDGATICRTAATPAEDGQSGFTPDTRLIGLIGDTHLNPKTGFRDDSERRWQELLLHHTLEFLADRYR